jgi:hypothetical protein
MKVKELTLRDTDAVVEYTEDNPDVIYTQTYNMLNHTWKKNKKISMVDLFIITLTDDEEMDEIILTVNDDEWEPALEMGLVYFEEVEDYEMCIQIKKLLETIK